MPLKLRLARTASILERVFDAIIPRRAYGNAEIDPYLGLATPKQIILRGRVLSRKVIKTEVHFEDDPSRWRNFKTMVALFNTREIPNVRVSHNEHETWTDEEGYFELILPRPTSMSGWLDHTVSFGTCATETTLKALLPSAEAKVGIISDIDDTLIKTDAWSLRRNLWNSLTGDVNSRYVFPDAIKLIQSLHNGVNPVYYVSSSPWNMHEFLTDVFERAGLVKGPKFLRDLGISDRKFVTGSHGQHKGDAIDEILAANPELSFILLGDTGQHDAHVYYDAIKRHPGRIQKVILRAATPKLSKENQIWVDKISTTKIPIFVGESYEPLLEKKSLPSTK